MRSIHTVGASNVMYIKCDAGHDYGHREGGFTNEEIFTPCPHCAEIAELITVKEEHKRIASVLSADPDQLCEIGGHRNLPGMNTCGCGRNKERGTD